MIRSNPACIEARLFEFKRPDEYMRVAQLVQSGMEYIFTLHLEDRDINCRMVALVPHLMGVYLIPV